MINSAVVWYSSCNDIYGVVAFDDNEYDCNYALNELLATQPILANDDSIKFQTIEDDDDPVWQYILELSYTDSQKCKFVLIKGQKIITRI